MTLFCLQSLVEYSLKDISYEVKTPTRHELKVLARPDDPIVFHFEDEREAQQWWTVVSSSLKEVHKGQLLSGCGLGKHDRKPCSRQPWSLVVKLSSHMGV